MRKIILTLVPAIALLLPQIAPAQGTLYLSNLGQTPTGDMAVGSDAWIASTFTTGTNSGGYVLNSIQLLLDSASGSPSGLTVSIYNFNNGQSGSSLDALSGSDPAAGGIFTYTATNLTLLPSAGYLIMLTSATPVTVGAYDWSLANNPAYNSSDRWNLLNAYYHSTDGSNWAVQRGNTPQFAVNATAVPEPATYALAGLSLAWLSFWRRRHNFSQRHQSYQNRHIGLW